MVNLVIHAQFGYVILTVVGTFLLNIWLSLNVGRARKKYDVKYPAMYSDTNQVFICIQRAHQNSLEQFPVFLVFLIIGGLRHPTYCAIAGIVWLLGRIVYDKGYYTGDPAKRNRGTFGYLGLFTLLFCNIAFALELLKII